MKTIGAYATVMWLDCDGNPEKDSEYSDVYFSFGDYDADQEPECDSFGVRDDRIFYYVDGEQDMEKLKQSTSDFKVLSYELEYQP